MGAAAKKFQTNVAVPPAPVLIPSQRPISPSVPSVTSVANDKDDNETILRTVHRSPGICLTAKENPIKPQLGDRLIKRRPIIVSNGIPFLQMRSVRSHSTSGREKGGILLPHLLRSELGYRQWGSGFYFQNLQLGKFSKWIRFITGPARHEDNYVVTLLISISYD